MFTHHNTQNHHNQKYIKDIHLNKAADNENICLKKP
jgi:hypothetical protein